MAEELPKVECEIPAGLWHLDGVPVFLGAQKLHVHAANEPALRDLVREKSGVKAGQLQASISGSSPANIAELVELSVRKALADQASASAKPSEKSDAKAAVAR